MLCVISSPFIGRNENVAATTCFEQEDPWDPYGVVLNCSRQGRRHEVLFGGGGADS